MNYNMPKEAKPANYWKHYDILIHSLFEGDHDKIVFPFKNWDAVQIYLRERFPTKNGWELSHDKRDPNKLYYDWKGNPSYEIFIRRNA